MPNKKEDHRSPMRATFADPKKVICKNCLFRDKTEVVVGDKVIKAGVTKQFCAAYPEPPDSNGKPLGILFYGDKCKYYQNEKEAVE